MPNFHLSDIHSQYPGKTVAMGTAITTRGIPTAKDMIKSLPYFKHLLPSFCKTASPGYFYIWYMGFDFNDPILSAPAGREVFSKYFNLITTEVCKGDFKVAIRFVKCNHSGKPAWAQNDALLIGYNDGMEYFYMINDDTIMTTNNWTDLFVQQLANFNPPNVGLVGPHHSGGNVNILTYHFVHRTHIDIFKFFYPRNFTDWFGDDWATHIYGFNNVKKMWNVQVKHTTEKGVRYEYHPEHETLLKGALDNSQRQLKAYLESRGVDWEKWSHMTPPPNISDKKYVRSVLFRTSRWKSGMLLWWSSLSQAIATHEDWVRVDFIEFQHGWGYLRLTRVLKFRELQECMSVW